MFSLLSNIFYLQSVKQVHVLLAIHSRLLFDSSCVAQCFTL